MSQNSGTWSNYFVFVENPLKYAKCWMVVHAFLCHGRPNYFGRSLNPWTKLIHFLWYFLLDSLSHELTWTWFGHGHLHGRMECDSTHHQNCQMWGKKKKETIQCDKRVVTCDVEIAQCEDETIKCEKKVKEPPNVTKELSHVMLELHNMRIESLNVKFW